MSKTKYPNRDALRKANDIYLDVMYQFVKRCLDKIQGTTAEVLITDALRWSSDNNIEEKIEISDITHLVRTYWYDSFEEQFEVIDRHYEARSAVGLIVEGRNRASHRPWDLDPEFTRTQLFLIAELLGKINRPNEQREVEVIRDDLFSDDTAERLAEAEKHLKEIKAENTEYKKSLSDTEKCLTDAEKKNRKYEKDTAEFSKQVDEKGNRINKLLKQQKEAKARNEKSKKDLARTKQRLKEFEAEQTVYKEHLATQSNKLKDMKDELASVQAEKDASEKYLAVTRNLLTTVAVGDQAVFPPLGTDTAARILDRRNTEKKNYLLNLLEQKQPVIIYVQSEEKIDELLVLVGPEKAAVIGRHDEQTSEAEETEILEKLEKGELIAIVSNTTLSTLAPSHCVEHFVFCHLVPDLDTFFKRCQPAFTPENNDYLHLIYNNEEDIAGLNQWLTQKYPDKEALRESYRELKKLAKANGGCVNLEEVYNALDMVGLEIETGLVIFEELGFLERDGKGILTLFLSPIPRELEESDTYCRGVELKKETAEFRTFQLECSVEQIWGEILERLNIESEQILRENSIHKIPFRISETEGDYLKDSQMPAEQPTEMVEKDSGVSDEIAETDHATKPRRANTKVTDKTKYRKKKHSIAERYVAETTVEDRDGIAAKVVELRINATGSKPLAWKKILEKLGLQNAQFHEVIRHSEGYRKAVIQRIKSLKAQEGGWEYNGKLEVLTGIELTEKELE